MKQTLVVLIQQHLVMHYTHINGDREETYYECEWKQAYELVHAGRIIHLMEERFGDDGATIASNILQLGHARVRDFLRAYGTSTKKVGKKAKAEPVEAEAEGPAIEADEQISSVETLKQVMSDMLKGRFLIEVQPHHFQPRTDIENGIRTELVKRLRGEYSSELKLMKEVNVQLQKRMGEMQQGDVTEQAGMKRKAEPTGGRSKKRTKVSAYDEEEEEVEYEINEDIVVRINHEKFLVVFRNAELVSLAEKRLGKTTALVYDQLLLALEPKIHQCRNEFESEEEAEEVDKKKRGFWI